MQESLSAEQKLTPMMEQYRSIKKTLSQDTILFFRLGDFYEMFFEDAARASEILSITLTGRDGGPSGRVPMCGIPYHSFQGYVRTLLDHNLKVAICEQIGDPKLAKGLVDRKITRIISPATYLDEESKGAAHEYMAAVVSDGKTCALAVLEMGTGEFYAHEMPRERLQNELALLEPREVILPQSLAGEKALLSFAKETLAASVTVYEDWIFEAKNALELLLDVFKLASERSLGFHDRPLALRASGAVLYYLRDHFHAALDHIQPPRSLQTGDYMMLDRETEKSLELVSTLGGRKDGPTLFSTIDQSLTPMGSRTLHHWVTRPLLAVDKILRRQDSVAELASSSELLESLRFLLKGLRDLERTLARLNYGVANARDLLHVSVFVERIPALQTLLQAASSPMLKETADEMTPFPELKELIDKAIVEAPPMGLREGGIVRDGYSKELDELRGLTRSGKSWILEFQQREMERTGIKSLRVKYSQVFGYAIEVSKANLHLTPPDYIRRQTLANAERFIVPELKAWDEKITGAEERIKALEYELFEGVRGKVLEKLAPLQAMARASGILDALASLAAAAVAKGWARPHVVASGELLIEGGRHPVVEAMLARGQFVENDAFLDTAENQLIVLTGPNMAGKSTYIRQVALIALLAQTGSFVPARSARIGLVDRIFTRIGASDNLAAGESTFMVEMVETARILQQATKSSLLILDEVGRGTSTFDGVSIAWAISEYLVQGMMRPRTLFATHYHELTQLEEHFPRIKNYNITVKETKDGIVFLRKVVRGGSDRSYGIHVARLAGIPKSVTDRAREILAILERENTEATQIIEGKKGAKKESPERQPTLFEWAAGESPAGTGRNHPVFEDLRRLETDGLTPLQALNKIAEWKERLKED
jgi:DNA mismatch repair protein MutS